MAERGDLAGRQPGQHGRQLGEGRPAGDQGVEPPVAEQVERQRESFPVCPVRPGDRADLAAADRQPAGVERPAETQVDLPPTEELAA